MKTNIILRMIILMVGVMLIVPFASAQVVADLVADPVETIEEPVSEELIADELVADEEGAADFLGINSPNTEEMDVTTTPAGQDNRINISVDDESLENVVAMFTKMSGINIVSTPTNLTGTVSVNLQDVEWKPALSSILAMHQMAIIERTPGSGIYTIIEKPEGMPEPLIVETLFLKHTTVPEVSPVIKGMMVANGNVSEFPSRNALVVRTTASNMGEIKELIKSIDISSRQVCIEAKFMELTDVASKKLGIKWSGLDEFSAGVGLGPFYSAEETVRKTMWDTQDANWNLMYTDDKYARYSDIGGMPVELPGYKRGDARANLFEDSTTETYGNVSAGNVPTRATYDTTESGQNKSRGVLDNFTKTVTEGKSAIIEMDTLEFVLSALKKTDGVSVISNPKMIVANGTTNAFFRVGRRFPIIRSTVMTGTESAPGTWVDARLDLEIDTDFIDGGYLRTGVELVVVPTVKTEDLIEVEIVPTLINKIADKKIGENSWPELSVKEIRTRFTLLSGQSIAIGGLTTTEDTKRTSKIPLLGDIPLIGKYLFSHTEDVKSQIETIIFVTLTLAEPHALYETVGIPEMGELVHTRVLKDRARNDQFHADLEKLKEAADAERESKFEKMKDELHKRSR